MSRRTLAVSLAAVAPFAGFAACGIFSSDVGLARVEDLVTWIERVHVNAELSREKVQGAVGMVRGIASPDFNGNPVAAYGEFTRTIEASKLQAEELRSSFRAMKDAAEPVFEQWSEDLLSFTNAAMRQRSQARLAATRERYDRIVATVGPAQTTYDVFNVGLSDIALFLGHDFNPAAVAEIEGEVQALSELSADLDGKFDTCLQATEAYIAWVAMPGPDSIDGGRDTGRPSRPLGSADDPNGDQTGEFSTRPVPARPPSSR